MTPPPPDPRALLITGTVGAGKTSVADALGDLLTEAAVPNAILDADWLSRSWPSPPDDPFNSGIGLRNLRSVTANYLDVGVRRIVVAGVVENRAERDACQEALGIPLTVCRLRVALPTVQRRLTRRHENDGAGLRWHISRSGELHDILERARVEDVVVEVGDGSVQQVARAVVTALGW